MSLQIARMWSPPNRSLAVAVPVKRWPKYSVVVPLRYDELMEMWRPRAQNGTVSTSEVTVLPKVLMSSASYQLDRRCNRDTT